MNADRWEVALHKQLIQLCSPSNTFNKYNNLVEIQCIKKIIQLPVLLKLAQLDVVLSGTMGGKMKRKNRAKN